MNTNNYISERMNTSDCVLQYLTNFTKLFDNTVSSVCMSNFSLDEFNNVEELLDFAVLSKDENILKLFKFFKEEGLSNLIYLIDLKNKLNEKEAYEHLMHYDSIHVSLLNESTSVEQKIEQLIEGMTTVVNHLKS